MGNSMPKETEIETCIISKFELQQLRRDAAWLQYLEGAGVDNWDGIDEARELAQEAGFFEDE